MCGASMLNLYALKATFPICAPGICLSSLYWMNSLMQGRVSGMLSSIPIYAVKVEDLGERGAQYTALKLLQEVAREKERASGMIASSVVFVTCVQVPYLVA